jgi:hypothetical protein
MPSPASAAQPHSASALEQAIRCSRLKHKRVAAINAHVQCMANLAAVSPAACTRAMYWPGFRIRAAAGQAYVLAD